MKNENFLFQDQIILLKVTSQEYMMSKKVNVFHMNYEYDNQKENKEYNNQ
jgi:hypothetical protein